MRSFWFMQKQEMENFKPQFLSNLKKNLKIKQLVGSLPVFLFLYRSVFYNY